MNLYGHRVNQLARFFNKRLNEKIASLGLYSSQWAIILYLYEKKQCTQVELSHYLCVEAPTITRTLARMEEMGWITRHEGKDKRERHIQLTERAYEIFEDWNDAAHSLEIKATKDITDDELEIFNCVVEKMMKNLE